MSLPIALELYSVRDLYRENFEECLKKTAALGYKGVECFGAPTLPADRVSCALSETGLTLVGWHTPIERLEGDALADTMAYYQTVGCTRAVVPWMDPSHFATPEAVLALAARMQAISEAMKPYGIALGYHNHGQEFVPLADGRLPWAVLMDNTDIIAQLDNGNALSSQTPGLDTVKLVSQWPNRAETVHLKPYSQAKGYATMIGEDDIDWPAFLAAAENPGGAKWLIVEYEEEKLYEQFEGAELCLRALEKLGA